MLKDILDRIHKRLKEVGLSASAASSKAGLSKDAIRNIERSVEQNKEAGASTMTLTKLAPVLQTTASWLIEGTGPEEGFEVVMSPIVGKAGAGPDGSVLFATGDGNFGEVPAPEGASTNTSALEVQGDSMRGLANDGWIIFYEEREDPNEEHMGEPCVCFLEDERVLIKTPYPGSQPGLFHLESMNAQMMLDVAVRQFAFITDIKPRRSARKHIRRNPEAKVENVSLGGERIS